MHCYILKTSLLLLVAITSFAGCSKEGIPRKDVWGTVTWKGQPVPEGIVTFEPDRSRGNSGPIVLGFATIKEGKYDTRSVSTFKGCIVGPTKVRVQGFDGQNKTPDEPYGNELFPQFSLDTEIPENGGEMDFVVPDSVSAKPNKR